MKIIIIMIAMAFTSACGKVEHNSRPDERMDVLDIDRAISLGEGLNGKLVEVHGVLVRFYMGYYFMRYQDYSENLDLDELENYPVGFDLVFEDSGDIASLATGSIRSTCANVIGIFQGFGDDYFPMGHFRSKYGYLMVRGVNFIPCQQ